jgi:hypothetical protein
MYYYFSVASSSIHKFYANFIKVRQSVQKLKEEVHTDSMVSSYHYMFPEARKVDRKLV